MTPVIKPLILASKSAGRQQMLKQAGLVFESVAARIDEESICEGMQSEGAKPREIADSLAEAKALKISRKFPRALVIGSDQILVGPDGDLASKAESPEEAEITLAKLAGKTHRLISAAVICEGGKPVWRIVDSAKLTMKAASAEDIIAYVERYWEEIRHCVGCYRIEAEGAELFEKVEGNRGTVIGMPLDPMLDYLMLRGYERQP